MSDTMETGGTAKPTVPRAKFSPASFSNYDASGPDDADRDTLAKRHFASPLGERPEAKPPGEGRAYALTRSSRGSRRLDHGFTDAARERLGTVTCS